MDKKFFETNEKKGYNELQYLNKALHINELGATPKKWVYDASGFTSTTNEPLVIENKKRDQTVTEDLNVITGISKQTNQPYTATTMMIEEHKVAEVLLHSIVKKAVPLYVNFLNDGYVYLFNLNKMPEVPQNKPNVQTYSKGYERTEREKKYYLPLQWAWIYKISKNEAKLIRKPEV